MNCPPQETRNKFNNVKNFRDELWVDPEVDLDYCESACTGIPKIIKDKFGNTICKRDLKNETTGCNGIRDGCRVYIELKRQNGNNTKTTR